MSGVRLQFSPSEAYCTLWPSSMILIRRSRCISWNISRMCSRCLRNGWPKSRMNQVRSLSAWSLTTRANTEIADSKSFAQAGESEEWRRFPKTLIKRSGGAHEHNYFGACPEHADTRRFAPAVLGKSGQHSGVSDQQRTFSASKLWDFKGDYWPRSPLL